MLKEFKEFAFKGNVLDLAIGVIIAGAFGLIVKSLVDDIIMPIVGAITGGYRLFQHVCTARQRCDCKHTGCRA